MAEMVVTEAQLVGAMGDAALAALNRLIQNFAQEGDSLFYGSDVAEYLYERATSLQEDFQAKIDLLESGLTVAEVQAQEGETEDA